MLPKIMLLGAQLKEVGVCLALGRTTNNIHKSCLQFDIQLKGKVGH